MGWGRRKLQGRSRGLFYARSLHTGPGGRDVCGAIRLEGGEHSSSVSVTLCGNTFSLLREGHTFVLSSRQLPRAPLNVPGPKDWVGLPSLKIPGATRLTDTPLLPPSDPRLSSCEGLQGQPHWAWGSLPPTPRACRTPGRLADLSLGLPGLWGTQSRCPGAATPSSLGSVGTRLPGALCSRL